MRPMAVRTIPTITTSGISKLLSAMKNLTAENAKKSESGKSEYRLHSAFFLSPHSFFLRVSSQVKYNGKGKQESTFNIFFYIMARK
jgi:hypothetical protein